MAERDNTIDQLLSRGEIDGGHRSRARAKAYLPSLKTALALSGAADPSLDRALEEFIIEAVLGAAWYEKRYRSARGKAVAYIALNIALVTGLPLALIGLGRLAGPNTAKAVAAQITALLTGVLALQKTLAGWYASQQRFAIWYKSASDLKSAYYGLVQMWQHRTGDPGFLPALEDATAAARAVISNEQLDFYQKLALPSFDILDMLTGTQSTVASFVTSLVPGGPATTVAVVGKNLIAAAGPMPSTPPPAAAVSSPQVQVLAPGAAKENPYTLVIVANPAVEIPVNSKAFAPDPILTDQAQFNASAQYVITSVFGKLPNQAETFMQPFEPAIRVLAIFDPTLEPDATTALVAAYLPGDLIGPRQDQVAAFLAGYQIGGKPVTADVVFAITALGAEKRSASLYTVDDDTSPGVAFTLDGQSLVHRYRNQQPGSVALHVSATSVVALHEFGHAASSLTNGCLQDLYDDEDLTDGPVNIRTGRPVRADFAAYAGKTYPSDLTRTALGGYPAGWQSYHCALDDFWLAAGGPEACRHDQITLAFLTDRIRALMSRP
jgi:hypothetical protein